MARDAPLRSEEEPKGLRDLSPQEWELTDIGTDLAPWTVKFAQSLHDAGGYVSFENPLWGYLWYLPDVRELWETPGLGSAVFLQQQLGTEYRKDMLILHGAKANEVASVLQAPCSMTPLKTIDRK